MSRVTSALSRAGVERLRVGPNRPQPGAASGIAQARQRNGIALPVRELGVVLSLAGEVGIDLENMADIDRPG